MEQQDLYYHLGILIDLQGLSKFLTITLLCQTNFRNDFQVFIFFGFRVRSIFIPFLRISRDLSARLSPTQISYASVLSGGPAALAQNIQG